MEQTKTTRIDYYKVLAVKPDCKKEDLDHAYRKLILKYHPDKLKTKKNISPEKLEQAKEMFNLINKAYEVLTTRRKQYDEETKLINELDPTHLSLKQQADAYLNSQKSIADEKDFADFSSMWEKLNKKHGIKEDRDQVKREYAGLKEKDTQKLMEERLAERQKQNIEYKHELLFTDPMSVDPKLFNKLFEKKYRKEKDKEIIRSGDIPSAWNLMADNSSNFGSIGKETDIYEEEQVQDGSGAFSSIKFDQSDIKVTKEDLKELDGTENDFTFEHNKKEENYNDIIKKKLEERNSLTKELENMSLKDFSKDFIYGITQPVEGLIQFDESDFIDSINAKHYKELITNK